LFFFIGAPLGSIIRKGGLGMPAVLSVFLFILYYTIDTFGWKMARQGVWPIWEGMWLSTLVLCLLGLFLTYKAVNDSVVINPDAWKEMLQRLIGKREMRNYSRKELIMEFPEYAKDIFSMETWNEEAKRYLAEKQKPLFYHSFWRQSFRDKPLNRLLVSMNRWIEDLRNSDENLIIGKLMDYPIIAPYSLTCFNKPLIRWGCAVFFPFGICIFILFLFKQKQINNDIRITMKVNEEISKELQNLKLDCNPFS
jgi:lipopolysaccharide export system permease protein